MIHGPLPADQVEASDLRWMGVVINLAIQLYKERLHPRVVRQLLPMLKDSMIKQLMEEHWTGPLRPGPIRDLRASFFTTAGGGKEGSRACHNLQGATLIQCYLILKDSSSTEINRAWLLLNAYLGYKHIVHNTGLEPIYDINQAWALIRKVNPHSRLGPGEIAMKPCSCCGRQYLIETAVEPSVQVCPLFQLDENHRRLTELSRINSKRRATA